MSYALGVLAMAALVVMGGWMWYYPHRKLHYIRRLDPCTVNDEDRKGYEWLCDVRDKRITLLDRQGNVCTGRWEPSRREIIYKVSQVNRRTFAVKECLWATQLYGEIVWEVRVVCTSMDAAIMWVRLQ